MKKILIIDDDSYICNLLVGYLEQNDFKTEGTLSGLAGIKRIEKEDFDLVISDFRLPDTDGLEILRRTKEKKASLPVIIMTAYADVQMAVKLIKAGAFDYVTKPIYPEEILQLVNRAIDSAKSVKNNLSFSKEFVKGTSSEIQNVLHHVSVVAPTDLTVLIEGETGSGKEYIARAIHHASKRKKKPFIAVDCGAIPRELANSELFGHIKGSFTGAIHDKIGVFEQAKGGTLFLDEVGNLTLENQTKLLRALQEHVISRVGDTKMIKTDIRLIAATNEDLLEQLHANRFREDLYHRLNGFKIKLPPLRERQEDIREFTDFFIKKANKNFNKQVTGIDESVEEIFLNYAWPGNIRELQNILNRAVLLAENDLITASVLPEEIRYSKTKGYLKHKAASAKSLASSDLKGATEIIEKEVIANALIACKYNKSKAAKMLNIDRKTLYNKIKLYNIDLLK